LPGKNDGAQKRDSRDFWTGVNSVDFMKALAQKLEECGSPTETADAVLATQHGWSDKKCLNSGGANLPVVICVGMSAASWLLLDQCGCNGSMLTLLSR